MQEILFTIGHSNHPFERFLGLLHRYNVSVVADVRSSPYSRHNPQYNRELLQQSLQREGISYLYFGAELGARCSEPACFQDGRIRFELVAKTEPFGRGLDRIRSAIAENRMALMCAEKEPLQCHRTVLVCRHLRKEPFSISHILADGSLETQNELEVRLLKQMQIEQGDLFMARDQLIDRAYDLLEERMNARMRPKDRS